MMVSVLAFTVVGSYVANLVPSSTMGGFSVFMTFLLGVKFIVKPVMTTKEAMLSVSARKRVVQSIVCGILIGFICGVVGAGGEGTPHQIHRRRCPRRVYLWLRRRGRRHDDAADFDLRAGL